MAHSLLIVHFCTAEPQLKILPLESRSKANRATDGNRPKTIRPETHCEVNHVRIDQEVQGTELQIESMQTPKARARVELPNRKLPTSQLDRMSPYPT